MRTRLPAALAALLFALPAFAQREAPSGFDAFGYRLRSSPHAACPAQWIDLSAGTPLTLVAAGDDAAADDDGGTALPLPLPMRFYGQTHAGLVVSSNGYVAFADGLDDEDGGHWRSDCPLPAIPDNRHARFARIHALAADLERGALGDLRWQHFADCPRPAARGSDACTVVQWLRWQRRGTSGLVDMQVVLYHASGEIAVQYGDLDALATAGATVGIQDGEARSALALACGTAPMPLPASAACWYDDPPQVDVGLGVEPAGAGTVAGAGSYIRGDEVVAEAVAGSGHVFLDWQEQGMTVSNAPSYVFTGNSDRQLVARFVAGDTIFANGFEADVAR